jgi:CDP-glucose 4,6-dehydratase
MLAERLYNKGTKYTGAWNFGPDDADAEPVEWIVKSLCEKWGGNAAYTVDKGRHPHEAGYLRLDCSKAKIELGWKPKWDIEKAIDSVVDWTMVYNQGKDIRQTCLTQIEHYQSNV